MKFIKQRPLLMILLLSAFLLAGAGLAGAEDDYLTYRQDGAGNNPISWVFLGIRDGVWPWNAVAERLAASGGGAGSAPDEADKTAGDREPEKDFRQDMAENGGEKPEDQNGENGPQEDPAGTGDVQVREETGQAGSSAPDEGMEENAEPQTYEFETVDESYFDDALFIGDSRTVGLWEYAGMQDRADFFGKTSLTIWDVLEKPIVKTEDGKNITVEQALQERQYGKIYLMLGINELGRGNTELFMEQYRKVVERIRELQPDAVLFVEGIMRVAGEKNRTDPIFNNTNINEKNAAIAMLADYRNIFYIDVNEAVCDEEGNLTAEYTFDQIHLKAAYYEIWKQFLLEHGIVK